MRMSSGSVTAFESTSRAISDTCTRRARVARSERPWLLDPFQPDVSERLRATSGQIRVTGLLWSGAKAMAVFRRLWMYFEGYGCVSEGNGCVSKAMAVFRRLWMCFEGYGCVSEGYGCVSKAMAVFRHLAAKRRREVGGVTLLREARGVLQVAVVARLGDEKGAERRREDDRGGEALVDRCGVVATKEVTYLLGGGGRCARW